ncbi:MAG: translation initiation factor IF-3 [Limisphaerales bacterium]
MSRPFSPRSFSPASFVRVNGKIRAREVRVIMDDKQLGVFPLNDALNMARQHGVDLVEISATATPPVCRLVDFGKYRYELAKKEKETKKHQHASTVKEVQLSPRIDPHDLGVKIGHAIDFLCEDMKVKVALKFRGREMAHTEFGFQVVNQFLAAIAPYGHQDFEPKLIGRGISVMISPLPRNKRAKNPRQTGDGQAPAAATNNHLPDAAQPPQKKPTPAAGESPAGGFVSHSLSKLEVK